MTIKQFTHTFIDSNVCMLAAWDKMNLGEYDTESDEQTVLMNSAWALAKKRQFQQPITPADITEGAKFKLSSGLVFIIDNIEGNFVRTSLEHGKKSNYRD